MCKIIYRVPYGQCRSLGVYIISPPHNEPLPTITSCSWDCNHFLVWIIPYKQIPATVLNFPYILSKRRSEEGKKIRRQYKNDIGVPYQAAKAYCLNQSGTCDCITTFTTDNNIIELTDNKPEMEYHPNPTKEDLLEYFGQRIRVRKMTPTEALRLMDVDDADIEKIQAAGIAKTNLYKLAGNSIVVSCLYHIFRTMFIPGQPENEGNRNIKQYTLFDYL